ncbi:MAG TPA: hypothetical protein DCP74_06880, partial [Bacteroidales bacterium]|nr:hypothetical protein [Bacteroidales bacterium]
AASAHLPWRAVPGGASVAPRRGARNDMSEGALPFVIPSEARNPIRVTRLSIMKPFQPGLRNPKIGLQIPIKEN